MERIKAVKEFRSKSKREDTRKLANTPTEVAFGEAPDTPFLVMPNHSASRRLYIPILYFEPPTIVSNACSVIPNASVELFGLLTSRMHMVWNSILCGRIRRDFRYSAGMVYNTFPSPKGELTSLKKYAQNILDVRKEFLGKGNTIDELYDPELMPAKLVKAHQALDNAVDRLYRKDQFESDIERTEYLFETYQKV